MENEIDFLLPDKHKSFSARWESNFGFAYPVMPKVSKTTSLQYLCNTSKKKRREGWVLFFACW